MSGQVSLQSTVDTGHEDMIVSVVFFSSICNLESFVDHILDCGGPFSCFAATSKVARHGL